MNNLEIEYKILIEKIPLIVLKNIKPLYMEQFYFDYQKVKHIIAHLFNFELSECNYVSRVRMTIYPDESIKYVLSLKTKGFIHNEYEKIIDVNLYNQIKALSVLSIIKKNRYVDTFENHVYEFDEFLNLSVEHFTCEVEIQNNSISVEEVIRNLKEHYCLEKTIDVTNDPKYQNVNLIETFKNNKQTK